VTDIRRLPSAQDAPGRSRNAGEIPSIVVLVIPSSELTGARIEAMLRGDPRWRVVVGAPTDLADLVDDHNPAIVIVALPPERVARTLEALSDVSRIPSVILLASEPHEAWSAQARRAGVRAVLRSDATAGELGAAIAATAAGLFVLHPDALRVSPVTVSGSAGAIEGVALTPRELEILEMMAEGLSNRTIASHLGISGYTVKFHVASILDKLGAASRTEAVTLGVRHGLISL
jgi:two-component system, NarL family, response regulator YdfI